MRLMLNSKMNKHDGPTPGMEVMIERTLQHCTKVYYELETCLVDNNRDWSKCQLIVKQLKECNEKKNANK